MKAKKLFTTYGKHVNMVTYEYRGHLYDVEYPKDWTYCATPPKIQHENAQYRIDKQIEEEAARSNKPRKPEDDAEYGFNLFWDYVEGK